MIQWTSERAGGEEEILVLHLQGRLEAEAAEQLLSAVGDHIQQGDIRLVLDCRELSFISSAGVGVLVRIHTRMKQRGGDVRLACVQGLVADVIRLVMLDRLLQMYPSIREAVASYM